MYALLIYLCFIKLTNSIPDSDSEEKYIDLLPEKEKEEFLEKIARRILSKVETKESPAQSTVEVSDEQLNTHDEFVQKIFNEETESLLSSRRNNSKENDKSENNNGRINDVDIKNEPNDDVDTIKEVDKGIESLDKNKLSNSRDSSKQYLDLTLRTGKRRKRENDSDETDEDVTEKSTTTNEPIETVSVKLFYEEIDEAEVKTEASEYFSNDRELSDTSPIVHETTTEYIDNNKSIATTQNNDNKFEDKSKSDIKLKGLASFENINITHDIPSTTFVNVDEPTLSSSEVTTTKYKYLFGTQEIPSFEHKTILTIDPPDIIEDNPELKQNILRVSSIHDQNISLENKSSISVIIKTTPENVQTVTENDETNNLTTLKENAVHAETVTDITSVDNNITSRKHLNLEAVSVTDANSLTKTHITTDLQSKNDELFLNFGNSEKVTNSYNKLQLNNDNKIEIESTSLILPLTQITTPFLENVTPKVKSNNKSNIVEYPKSSLREGYEFSDVLDEKTKERHSPDDVKNVKQYLVYEIPRGQEPFIPQNNNLKTELQQEVQPHFIPVYNYAPSYAYFSAYNRLGPNDGDHDRNDNEYLFKQDDAKNTATPDFDVDYYFDIGDRRNEPSNRKFRFSDKKKAKRKKTVVRKPMQNINLPVIFRRPKDTKVYYNPKDYLDLDYYYRGYKSALRGNECQNSDESATDSDCEYSIFADSGDDDHPFNSIKERKIKNHLSAVRQILFNNNHFGYVDGLKSKKGKQEPKDKSTGNVNRFRSKDYDYIIINPKSKTTVKDSLPKIDEITDYFISKTNDGIKYETNDLDKQYFRSLNENHSGENPTKNTPYGMDGDVNFDHHEVTTPAYFINPTVTVPKNLTKLNQIKFLLDMSDASDLLNVYNKLTGIKRTKNDNINELSPYVNVLRDMINNDKEALANYDWLGTTVDIEGALRKIYDLTELVQNNESIDPFDYQLLKYVIYLYEFSKAKDHKVKLSQRMVMSLTKMQKNRIRKMLLPRNKKKRGKIKNPLGLLKEIYKFLRKIKQKVSLEDGIEKNSLEEFREFLYEWRRRFYDIHEAISAITTITKYNDQKWHKNLKELYLKSPKRKHLLEVLLHLFSSRLLELVEITFQSSLDEKLDVNLNKNNKEVRRTKEEFAFVLKVIEELKSLD